MQKSNLRRKQQRDVLNCLRCAPRRFSWAFAGAMVQATKEFLK